MLAHQSLELGNHLAMPAKRQIELQPLLEHEALRLHQPSDRVWQGDYVRGALTFSTKSERAWNFANQAPSVK